MCLRNSVLFRSVLFGKRCVAVVVVFESTQTSKNSVVDGHFTVFLKLLVTMGTGFLSKFLIMLQLSLSSGLLIVSLEQRLPDMVLAPIFLPVGSFSVIFCHI